MRRYLAAATDWRTLLWLGAGLVASALLSNPFPALVGLGLYCWFVTRLGSSAEFATAAEKVQVAEGLAQRFKGLQQAAQSLTPRLPNIVLAGSARPLPYRAGDVLNAVYAIYHEWLARREEHADKAALVDEAMQLANLYLRLVHAFVSTHVQKPAVDLNAVYNRMVYNQQRLQQTMDLETRQSLMQAVEIDQRILKQAQDASVEQERYLAKLSAIESTMDMLRRQVYDPATSGEGERLHEMLLEAEAMDEAMEEVHRQTRVRAR